MSICAETDEKTIAGNEKDNFTDLEKKALNEILHKYKNYPSI